MKKITLKVCAVLMAMLLTACGGGGGSTSSSPEFKTLPSSIKGVEGN